MSRADDLRLLLTEHLDSRTVSVPLEMPISPALTVKQALGFLVKRDFDLTLLDTPELLIADQGDLRAVVDHHPDAAVRVYSRPPGRSQLIDSRLPLQAVVERLMCDPSPLLVVGNEGLTDVVTVADFAGVGGTAVVLTTLALLDAEIDRLLHANPKRQFEAWRALPPDQQTEATRLSEQAKHQGAGLSALAFVSFSARLSALDEVGPVKIPSEHRTLLIDVRNSVAHGRQLTEAQQALDALHIGLELIDQVVGSFP